MRFFYIAVIKPKTIWQSLPIYAIFSTLQLTKHTGHSMSTLNISITDDMREWVDQQVASGRYVNASDYIRDLIRTNQSTTDAIRLALIEGEQSGESNLTIDNIMEMEFSANEAISPLK